MYTHTHTHTYIYFIIIIIFGLVWKTQESLLGTGAYTKSGASGEVEGSWKSAERLAPFKKVKSQQRYRDTHYPACFFPDLIGWWERWPGLSLKSEFIYLWRKERRHMHAQAGVGHTAEGVGQAGSLRSLEPAVGLHLSVTTLTLWPERKLSPTLNWATQAPLLMSYFNDCIKIITQPVI